jgi:hypothetical protein
MENLNVHHLPDLETLQFMCPSVRVIMILPPGITSVQQFMHQEDVNSFESYYRHAIHSVDYFAVDNLKEYI